MKIVYSEKFLEHETFLHPECKERLLAIVDYLMEKGLNKGDFIEPVLAEEKDLLLVHEQRLLDELKMRSKRLLSTGDNVFNKNTYEIALFSAGSALTAARLCDKEFAFSLARPPGHHAGISSFGGFCYLNNIAFAVRKIQRERGLGRVMIVDFDVHLGQGTLEIFENDPSVFYLSFHQNPETIYPWQDFDGKKENIKKAELEPGTTDKEYLELFEKETKKAAKEFKPGLIAVSAGFDVFFLDSMVGNRLEIREPKTFYKIGNVIKGLKKPVFAVLEGGYALQTLGENVFNFLRAFY